MSITQQEKKRLQSIDWEKFWPVLSPLHLAYLELEQDEYYSFLPNEQLTKYLTGAMEIGITAAQSYQGTDIISLINKIFQAGIRIQFIPQHPTHSSIRAQYDRKRKKITIYRSSITQIQQFLSSTFGEINELEIIQLHLFHEWFHHLEETKLGRTDLQFPSVIIKKRGPFLVKRPLARLREIAAHSFTQTALGLTWSPLLLDQYRVFLERGYTNAQIRESFQATGKAYYAIINN